MFTASLNFALGEDIDALRDLVQSWARDRLAPMAAEIDRSNVFSAKLALREALPVATADRAWADFDLGCGVELIR